MYYSKLSNAYNSASTREIDATDKFPANSLGFAKQRAEYEIVGAFASDPINITSIISGDGSTPGTIITVTTATDHGLTTGTPIKINGVDVLDYNISTKVQNVTSATTFTYLLPFVRDNLFSCISWIICCNCSYRDGHCIRCISLYLQHLSPFCLWHERYAR